MAKEVISAIKIYLKRDKIKIACGIPKSIVKNSIVSSENFIKIKNFVVFISSYDVSEVV